MSDTQVFRTVISTLARNGRSDPIFTKFDIAAHSMSARIAILGSCVGIKVVGDSNGRYLIGASGASPVAARWLHDVLVVHSRLVIGPDGRELQVLLSDVPLESLVEGIIHSASFLYALRAQEEAAEYDPGSAVSMYWSSGVLNFGDWSGPHIVHSLTGRQPIQSNRPGSGGRALYSVGSILGWIKRNNVDVWGSGLIKPLTSEEIRERSKLVGIRIHAVRGRLTKENLEKCLDWDVPSVFGDPALLVPDFVPRGIGALGGVTVVPHHIHRSMLVGNGSISTLVDVRKDVYDVCRSISQGSAVVSTSLHGLIIAQAYSVPWVWLQVEDKPLIGNDFKFEDFFSCLDREAVSIVRTTTDELYALDFESVASAAKLPEMNIDLNLLREAIPVQPAESPAQIASDRALFA